MYIWDLYNLSEQTYWDFTEDNIIGILHILGFHWCVVILWKLSCFLYQSISFISHFIEVWHFTDDYTYQKIQVPAEDNNFSNGSYLFPYILQSVTVPTRVNETSDSWEVGPVDPVDEAPPPKKITQITVWKVTLNPLSLHKHMEIADVEQFFKVPHGSFRMDEFAYIQSVFMLTCKVPLTYGDSTHNCLAIRVVNEEGTMIKQCLLTRHSPDAYVSYLCFERRLLITVDEDVFICLNDVADLQDPNSKPIGFRLFEELGDGNDLMLRKLEASTVCIQLLGGERNRLAIRTLNFWSHVYPDPSHERELRRAALLSLDNNSDEGDTEASE